MKKTIRERISRHDSVTESCREEEDIFCQVEAILRAKKVDQDKYCAQVDEDFLDAVDNQVDEFQDAQETASSSASTRVFQAEYLLERILLHNSPVSTRNIAKDLLGGMRVDKNWQATIKDSGALQRLMWFTPSLKQPPGQKNSNEKVYIDFNPILWPTQPSGSTVEVSHSMLNPGSRGPGSWRKMLVASASQRRFVVVVKVEGTQVAVVRCDTKMTIGKLLDTARQGTGKYDFDIFEDDETAAEDFDFGFCICVMQGLPTWQRCEECLRDGGP